MADMNNVSLGSATSTRLDSGCKDIQQCRVSQDHLTRLADGGADRLKLRKYQYAVHKDELVLGVAGEWSLSPPLHGNNAYPRVISNLGDADDATKNLIKFAYHNIRTISERKWFQTLFQRGDTTKDPWYVNLITPAGADPFIPTNPAGSPDVDAALPVMFDCIPVGYSNTIGYAHRETGDTMTSVMIGGLRTVRNGDFEVHCGDIIQWYWPFERDCFTQDGRRREINPRVGPTYTLNPTTGQPQGCFDIENSDPATCNVPNQGAPYAVVPAARDRQNFFERQYGNIPKNGKHKGYTKLVPFVKPYKQDDQNPRLYDWVRVFAIAIGSAGPHQDLDIKISRQSM